MFIKIFLDEMKAIEFTQLVKGTYTVHYDWDNMRNKIVKEFIVKYK